MTIEPLGLVRLVAAGQVREPVGATVIQPKADGQTTVLVVGLVDVVEVFARHPQVLVLVGHQHMIYELALRVWTHLEQQLIVGILDIPTVRGNRQPGAVHPRSCRAILLGNLGDDT